MDDTVQPIDNNPISKVLAMAQGAAKPEAQAAGPGDVKPTGVTQDQSPLVTLPLTEAQLSELWKQVELATERTKQKAESWDVLLSEYLPIVKKSGEAETVKYNGHFRNVHSKIGQLFYRSPELILSAKDPGPANNTIPNPTPPQPGQPPAPPLRMEDIIAIKQAVLMAKLGPEGINAERLMDEQLFDVLAWAGLSCAKFGYHCTMKSIQQPKMVPAPPPPQLPGSILGLQPPQTQQAMVPDPSGAMETVSVPVYEEYYGRRFSPKKFITNTDLRSTRFDEDATLMGMHFYLSPKDAMATFGLTEDQVTSVTEDDQIFKYKDEAQGGEKVGLVHGVECWVKASYYTDEVHPLAMAQLVLIYGMRDKPAVWRMSPDQSFDPKTGRLTDDSVTGFPIRVLTIRDLADSSFPPADSAFTNSGIKQISTWRRQSVSLRDAAIGKIFIDGAALGDPGDIEKIKNGDVGEIIVLADGALKNGSDKIMARSPQVQQTQDDYRNMQLLKQDNDETLGIGSTQAGAPEQTVRTATEISTVNNAVAGRNNKELARTIGYYLACARMVDQFIMRYATANEYVQIVGQDGAQTFAMWNRSVVSGKWLYDIAPDSQLHADVETTFQQELQLYNMTAKDSLVNRVYQLRRLFRLRGMDPAKAVLNPATLPKPQPQPVQPSISFAFKGENLSDPVVLKILLKAELMTPEDYQAAMGRIQASTPPQPPHAGSMPKGDTVNQHVASNSGRRPNEPGAPNHRENQV